MEIKPGTTLKDRFEFRRYLASGGFGQVWEGYDRDLQRAVAIKRLLRNSFGAINKEELLEEARRVAALNHPNIVVVHDVSEFGDEVFIIMEFLPGGSLHDRLRNLSKDARWISATDGIRLIRDMLRGLEAAHGCEGGAIIHRDLKPQNILFDRNDTPKIVDFGLAAVGVVSPLPTADRAISFEHAGTWGYKSPEQLKGLKLDQRSDLFNVGLIAYLAFAGMHPFIDERLLFDYREMVLQPYRQIRTIEKNTLPHELGAFILNLLEREPTKRFSSATQALSEFENVETAFRELLEARCLKHLDAVIAGEPSPEAFDSNDLATGISLLKQSRQNAKAKLLYEKGGLDLSQLSEVIQSRVNEDYATCCRRLEKEGTPA